MPASATRSPTSVQVVRPVDRTVTPEELRQWGEALGATLQPGDLVALHGNLGAGKTTLAQAIARGFGVAGEVTSPTYALAHQYQGHRGVMWHLDLYRIGGPRELEQLGWHDMVSGDAVVVIEWPERAEAFLPVPRLDVYLATVPADTTVRHLRVA